MPRRIRKKVVLVGGPGSGKSALVRAVAYNVIDDTWLPMQFENSVIDVQLEDRTVEMALWNTQCHDFDMEERMARLRALSYQGAHAVIIAFAIDDPETFHHALGKWVTEVQSFYAAEGTTLPVFLVGCKADRRTNSEGLCLVPAEEAERAVTVHGLAGYIECTARSAVSREWAMARVARECCSSYFEGR